MAPYIFAVIALLVAPRYPEAKVLVDAAAAAHRPVEALDVEPLLPRSTPAFVDAIVNAVDDEGLALFNGDWGGVTARERTAYLLVAVAFNESSFADDVATCTAKVSKARPQDLGKSIGATQLYQGPTWYGHTREEICDSVALQFRLALRFLAEGHRACPGSIRGALSYYNAGPAAKCRDTMQSRRTYLTFGRLVTEAGRWPRAAAVLAQN